VRVGGLCRARPLRQLSKGGEFVFVVVERGASVTSVRALSMVVDLDAAGEVPLTPAEHCTPAAKFEECSVRCSAQQRLGSHSKLTHGTR
jgi:hypothetical protein